MITPTVQQEYVDFLCDPNTQLSSSAEQMIAKVFKVSNLDSISKGKNDTSQKQVTQEIKTKTETSGSVTNSNTTTSRKTTTTKGGGDCALHAILGTRSRSNQTIECSNVNSKRIEVGNAITDEKDKLTIKPLIEEAIKELIMSGRDIGPATKQLKGKYDKFLDDQEATSPKIWLAFENVLREENQYASILQYIETNHQLRKENLSLREKFYDALNRNNGQLYTMISRFPKLQEAFLEYNKIANTQLDWSANINKEIKQEYAKFVSTPGTWLLPSELAIIAKVFDLKVVYYPSPDIEDSKPLTLNPTGKQSTVTVQFNGRDHYEQVESSNAVSTTSSTATNTNSTISVLSLTQAEKVNLPNNLSFSAVTKRQVPRAPGTQSTQSDTGSRESTSSSLMDTISLQKSRLQQVHNQNVSVSIRKEPIFQSFSAEAQKTIIKLEKEIEDEFKKFSDTVELSYTLLDKQSDKKFDGINTMVSNRENLRKKHSTLQNWGSIWFVSILPTFGLGTIPWLYCYFKADGCKFKIDEISKQIKHLDNEKSKLDNLMNTTVKSLVSMEESLSAKSNLILKIQTVELERIQKEEQEAAKANEQAQIEQQQRLLRDGLQSAPYKDNTGKSEQEIEKERIINKNGLGNDVREGLNEMNIYTENETSLKKESSGRGFTVGSQDEYNPNSSIYENPYSNN